MQRPSKKILKLVRVEVKKRISSKGMDAVTTAMRAQLEQLKHQVKVDCYEKNILMLRIDNSSMAHN